MLANDGHRPPAFRGARPGSTRKENQMSTLKLVRAYARYVASSLATVAFRIASN
ncbi:MAG: hypothetical protein ACRDJW_09120 [Thermomicrobiales bacterium]